MSPEANLQKFVSNVKIWKFWKSYREIPLHKWILPPFHFLKYNDTKINNSYNSDE